MGPMGHRPTPDLQRDTTAAADSPVIPSPDGDSANARVMNRRVVVGSAVSLGAALAFPATRAQDGTGTPAASPAASPVATPVPTPEPPPAIGNLEIVRGQPEPDPESPVPGGTLRLPIRTADNANYNPVAFEQDFQILVSYLDPLVRPNPVTMLPEPWLAERWEWNEDQTVITYTLRPGVTWHDGSPLTAADVRFSYFVARDDVFSGVRNFFISMDDVDDLDERTVRVTLTAPDNTWLFNASSQFIVQRAQYTDYWSEPDYGERTLNGFDWAASPPLGTGPWQVTGMEGDEIVLARNADYWQAPPQAEELRLIPLPTAGERAEAFAAGEIDLVWPLAAPDLDAVAETTGRLHVASAASVMFAAFNFENLSRVYPYFLTELAVREALNVAIDRAGYAEDVFRSFIAHERAGAVAQPWANDPDVTNPRRNARRGRQTLVDLGWIDYDDDGLLDDSSGGPLLLATIVRDDARPELLATLEAVDASLREIGAGLDIQVLDAETFAARSIRTLDFDLVAFAYDLFPGFTDFDLYGSAWDIRINPQGWNPGGYRNLAVDQAISTLLTTVDPDAQRDLLATVQTVTNQDLFAFWFGFPDDLIATRDGLRGFQPNIFWQTADTRLLWLAPE